MTAINTTYNGWKNRQTWNVALWIGNDEPLYRTACDYVKRCRESGRRVTYRTFCQYAGLAGDNTPDGVAYVGTKLDYRALSSMINELVE